jgi:F-type H+-transporting ATPase subunit epsilon
MQIVVVTPEKAVLDEKAEFVVLPMIDGELGIQTGRAAMVGRLGSGELRITQSGQIKKMRIKGGFAQVRNNVVTVLTSSIG